MTIEERAKKCLEAFEDKYVYHDSDLTEESFVDGYMFGCVDQRKIDIDEACEAYRKELSEIIYIFNRIGKELYNINELGELISLEGSVKDFRKAIEL